jgi:hypothetical protein
MKTLFVTRFAAIGALFYSSWALAQAPEAPPSEAAPAPPPADAAAPPEPSDEAPPSDEDAAEPPAPADFAPLPPAETEPPPSGPVLPDPVADAARLKEQGSERPTKNDASSSASGTTPTTDEVFAEEWWTHARPVFELHGYFRTRAEMFHNFSLSRKDAPANALWAAALDNNFTTTGGSEVGPELCTAEETSASSGESDSPRNLFSCRNKTQSGANLRFRLNPELHVSDNLRVRSQVDMLDNLVLGSTPDGYAFAPADGGG